MKLFVLKVLCAAALRAQDVPQRFGPPDLGTAAAVAPTVEPSTFISIGIGGSTISDPHYGFTGAIGKRIAAGTYATLALDAGFTAAVDPATGHRKAITTLRPGLQKIMAQSGPFSLTVAGDVGGTVGPNAIVGQVSGGGSIAYTLPKHPDVFLYGNLRIVKSPQADPTLSNPAIVMTAFSVGVGFKLW